MDAAPRWAWRAASCPHTVTALAQQPWPCVWGRQDGLTDGPMLAVVSLVGKPAVPGAPASSRTPPRAGGERNVTLFLLLGALCAARGGVPRECRVCHVERLSAAFLAPWRRTCPVPWCLWWGRLDGTACRLATCGRPRARSAVRGRGGVSAACRCRLRSVGAWGGRHGGGTPGAWRTTGLFWSSDFGVLEPGSS